MYNYLIILQDNNLESRTCKAVKCESEGLLQEVIKVTGKSDSTIENITESFIEIGWNLTVIDLATYKIVE
jgi:hypothetical protein